MVHCPLRKCLIRKTTLNPRLHNPSYITTRGWCTLIAGATGDSTKTANNRHSLLDEVLLDLGPIADSELFDDVFRHFKVVCVEQNLRDTQPPAKNTQWPTGIMTSELLFNLSRVLLRSGSGCLGSMRWNWKVENGDRPRSRRMARAHACNEETW